MCTEIHSHNHDEVDNFALGTHTIVIEQWQATAANAENIDK